MRFIYPSLQAPPSFTGGESVFADKWIYAWSEPVRHKIAPELAIALMASGFYLTPAEPFAETVYPDKWFVHLAEPVRIKSRLLEANQSVFTIAPSQEVTFAYYNWLTEPTRQLSRLPAALNPFEGPIVIQPPASATLIQGWYTWLSEPVRELQGLKAHYQQTLAYHPRILPTPNVTLALNTTETNEDDATFGVNTTASSSSGTGSASVAITEIPANNQGAMSIREP